MHRGQIVRILYIWHKYNLENQNTAFCSETAKNVSISACIHLRDLLMNNYNQQQEGNHPHFSNIIFVVDYILRNLFYISQYVLVVLM